MISQGRSKRTATSAKRKTARGKRKYEIGSEPAATHVAETRRKSVKTRGGAQKIKLLQEKIANVTDPSTGKTSAVTIENVTDNEANEHYVRRNILTKGSIIKTELGDARITSRPGQDGVVNAILTK
ncbi:30S ribosomal protein S8e [Methanohalophilus mahii]|uniref:Small ribosomal subunit protein eS8 n=1 Tax=Methanohalophilus mahii (strain ATCC 35705 / DSM 5219 / SLP) TaxID=547558 RepID=D5E9H3_METMS|nr:30S ribosomal protein S8e [Methanohalophilus mahii]ADE35824.1 SSU ribosomal protein S8E [Methanohalophilus mahii DSM 5219]